LTLLDRVALLHKNANMRTSIDFPDPLFRTLKASAAMQGTSLRDHVLLLIERGMNAPAASAPVAKRAVSAIPSIKLSGGTWGADVMTPDHIKEFLNNDDLEHQLRIEARR
jgi:hypothetical protein